MIKMKGASMQKLSQRLWLVWTLALLILLECQIPSINSCCWRGKRWIVWKKVERTRGLGNYMHSHSPAPQSQPGPLCLCSSACLLQICHCGSTWHQYSHLQNGSTCSYCGWQLWYINTMQQVPFLLRVKERLEFELNTLHNHRQVTCQCA